MKLKVFLSACLIGFLFAFQVYTAKSLSVAKSGETFDDVQLQPLSDVETIEAEIEANSQPAATTPRTSSLFNFDSLNIFRMRKAMESSEDDIYNEIEKSDVIEIEVPVIGIEYIRKHHISVENQLEVVDNRKGYTETDIFTTPPTFDLSTAEAERDDVLTFSQHSQGSPSQESTVESSIETTTTEPEALSPTEDDDVTTKSTLDVIQSVESKLMEQPDEMIDDDFPESEMFTMKSRARPKYPFNVKIVVNNEDEKKSCRSKTSCSQVSFSRPKHDIDRQFYSDYSDEDLLYRPEFDRYFEMANNLRPRNARRAADDRVTPAPRIPSMRGLKKPSFVERLENESSLERSERVNKNLDSLMRFVSVFAHVDKFVSDRVRSTIKRIAHLTGDDYDDMSLGSAKRRSGTKRMADEPFT